MNIKYLVYVLPFSFFLVACSSNLIYEKGETFALLPADEMMQGPGLFSGEKGAFYVVGGDKKVAPKTTVAAPAKASKPISEMDLNETSEVLDERIRQLQRDQMELELLKRQINKKLNN